MTLALTYEEFFQLWDDSLRVLAPVEPEERLATLHLIVAEKYPTKNLLNIADRFYSLMVCLDASRKDVESKKLGIYRADFASVQKVREHSFFKTRICPSGFGQIPIQILFVRR